jgi:hypothetical protein
VAEGDVQELRQSSEEFSVALNDMSALLERVKLLQEEIAAQVNQQNNRSPFPPHRIHRTRAADQHCGRPLWHECWRYSAEPGRMRLLDSRRDRRGVHGARAVDRFSAARLTMFHDAMTCLIASRRLVRSPRVIENIYPFSYCH